MYELLHPRGGPRGCPIVEVGEIGRKPGCRVEPVAAEPAQRASAECRMVRPQDGVGALDRGDGAHDVARIALARVILQQAGARAVNLGGERLDLVAQQRQMLRAAGQLRVAGRGGDEEHAIEAILLMEILRAVMLPDPAGLAGIGDEVGGGVNRLARVHLRRDAGGMLFPVLLQRLGGLKVEDRAEQRPLGAGDVARCRGFSRGRTSCVRAPSARISASARGASARRIAECPARAAPDRRSRRAE